MALMEDVVQSVANANFKTMAEQVTSNVAAHQNRLNILAEKSLAKSLESMDTTQVSEGLGLAAANRSDLSKQIADLAASVAAMQNVLQAPRTPATGT